MYLLLLLLLMVMSFMFGWRLCNDEWLEAAEKKVHRFCRRKYFEVKEVGK
jgi:hypothetical protein